MCLGPRVVYRTGHDVRRIASLVQIQVHQLGHHVAPHTAVLVADHVPDVFSYVIVDLPSLHLRLDSVSLRMVLSSQERLVFLAEEGTKIAVGHLVLLVDEVGQLPVSALSSGVLSAKDGLAEDVASVSFGGEVVLVDVAWDAADRLL